jgi:hypothetical protein
MCPRARGRAGMMAMAIAEAHCDDLWTAGVAELGKVRAMRSEERGGGQGGRLHHRTESVKRSLALTSPTPQLGWRRA